MDDIKCTDSFWAESPDAMASSDGWSECELLHESVKGWCRVYSCLYRGRKIAVKVLKEEFRGNAVYVDLLRKEYEVGSMMNQENIVSVLGFENTGDFGPAILMEYVDGLTLDKYLQQNPDIGFADLESIIRQICFAVSYIHSRQIVHCDIKPSNIMLTRDGRYVKLIDFGMSRGRSFVTLKFPGGTEGYTAPECMAADGDVGPQADIYSIGRVVGYLQGPHRSCLDRVVRRCVAILPADRPARADEIPVLIRHARVMRRVWRRGLLVTAICVVGIVVWRTLLPFHDKVDTSVPTDNFDSLPVAVSTDSVVAADTVDEADSVVDTPTRRLRVESIVAETPADSTSVGRDVALAPATPRDIPFNEAVFRYTLQCAARRFAEHIAVIDTMNSIRSNELTLVKHWRWLAKQDVRRWLEEVYSAGNPYIETIMADVTKAVENYGNEDEQLEVERRHRVAACCRNPALNGAATGFTYPVGDHRMCRETLGEDGEWTREVYSTRPHPTPDNNIVGGTPWP